MRRISPQAEPTALSQFRAEYQNDINFCYDMIDKDLRERIKQSLIDDQQGLCAYTGISINLQRSHIEHLIPQADCVKGDGDVAYGNMVACYPGPDDARAPFGAHPKANWPSPDEQHLFVSPRSDRCEERFEFDHKGKVKAAKNDEAASETIRRLRLDDERLVAMRKEAIEATLKLRGKNPPDLNQAAARRRLAGLESAEASEARLEPYIFALKQALRKHIRKIDMIKASKKRKPK